MEHPSSLYNPPVRQGTKRWAMWAFMQGVWDNGSEKGVEPTCAMLESFLRNMYQMRNSRAEIYVSLPIFATQ